MSRGRRWAVAGLAVCALVGAGRASAQSIGEDPTFAAYRQAVEALDARDYPRAIALADEAIKSYPDHLLAHYVRAQAASGAARWDEAVAGFTKVTRLYPGSFAAHRDLGIALQQLGKPDEAVRAWEAALALRPDNDETRARLGITLVAAGQTARGLPHLEALAARDTKLPEVWTALGRVAYDKGDFPGAAKAFAKVVALRDDGRSWFNLGVLRLRAGDRPGALDAFRHAAGHAETREAATREIEKLRPLPLMPTIPLSPPPPR